MQISHNKEIDFTRWLKDELAKCASLTKNDYTELQSQLYIQLQQDFSRYANPQALMSKRVIYCDTILMQLWQQHGLSDYPDLCLIAIGGYGRGELYPYSDIDILILTPEVQVSNKHTSLAMPWQQKIAQFTAFLWDIGLQVGLSVRSLRDSADCACTDISIATTLLETRLLIGDTLSYQKLLDLFHPHNLWPMRAFFPAKIVEQQMRYRKYNDTAYNLEPNIKESPGGLRDFHLINWLMRRHFGIPPGELLIKQHFMTEEEYHTLCTSHLYLAKIRCGLHLITQRKEDRLLYNHQQQLAEQFCYQDFGDFSALECFMKDYYHAARNISVLTELFVQTFEEMLFYADYSVAGTEIDPSLVIDNNCLAVKNDQVIKARPEVLFKIFEQLTKQPQVRGIRANTLRLLRTHRHYIDQAFQQNKKNQTSFINILKMSDQVDDLNKTPIEMMYRYGLLESYLPVFARITGQMQYDLFHVYTVDRHLMYVIDYLVQYRRGTQPDMPLCTQIMHSLTHPEILYIAALFHDIGKGRGGDHSELGALDAEEFCQQHGLPTTMTQRICWLVQNHLLLSMTAQRKDLQDLAVIATFAEKVASQECLEQLFVLTVADICATNPSLWNNWRQTLLTTLYYKTEEYLQKGQSFLDYHQLQTAQKIRERILSDLRKHSSSSEQVEAIWQAIDPKYFDRNSKETIAWHSKLLANDLPLQQSESNPLIAMRNTKKLGGTEIFIYAQDDDHLFATITGVLEQLNLNIVAATVFMTDKKYSLNTYVVIDQNGKKILNKNIQQLVIDELQRNLMCQPFVMGSAKKKRWQHLPHVRLTTQIQFQTDESRQHTILELITFDRPGLLAKVGQVFAAHNIRLHLAKIMTLGERVEDVFFVTHRQTQCYLEIAQQKELQKSLLAALK